MRLILLKCVLYELLIEDLYAFRRRHFQFLIEPLLCKSDKNLKELVTNDLSLGVDHGLRLKAEVPRAHSVRCNKGQVNIGQFRQFVVYESIALQHQLSENVHS
jgi:hypothetical protein